jgi:hypothetical protein
MCRTRPRWRAAFGLDRDEALKAVTLYPAQILGAGDKIGSIEVGKLADLQITDGDPLLVDHALRAGGGEREAHADGVAADAAVQEVRRAAARPERPEALGSRGPGGLAQGPRGPAQCSRGVVAREPPPPRFIPRNPLPPNARSAGHSQPTTARCVQ